MEDQLNHQDFPAENIIFIIENLSSKLKAMVIMIVLASWLQQNQDSLQNNH